jgi:hypothetical protein
MIKFKFNWINQETPHHYRPPVPTAGDTARPDSNMDGTVWPD